MCRDRNCLGFGWSTWTFISVSGSKFSTLCSVGYVQNHTRGIYRGYYPTKNFCKFCRTFIPVPGTSVSSVRPCHKYPGYGYSILYLPGTSVSSVRQCHNTPNICEFCNTFVPVPGTFVSSVRSPYTLTRNFCDFCKTVAQYPGYGCTYQVCYNTGGAQYSFRFITKSALCIMTSCLVSHTMYISSTEQQHV